MAVHGVGYIPIRISVEIPVDELVALMAFVRGCPISEKAVGIRLALTDFEAFEAAVGN